MKKPSLIIGLVIASMLSLTTLSLAQPINACYHNKNGALRIVSDASQCTKSETFISLGVPQEVLDLICNLAKDHYIFPCPSYCDCLKVRIVFVSSQEYTGDLGGLAGADAKCQALADAAGITGTFKAWLSDSLESPATRFTHSYAPYIRVDRTVIATDWDDLVDGMLTSPINLNEYKKPITYNSVWTNTTDNGGGMLFRGDCNGWTSSASDTEGSGGVATATEGWSSAFSGPCSNALHLYCFQQ